MLVIYVNSRLNHRSRREGRELSPTTVWRQFSALFSTPAVEPRVLSCSTAKQRFQIRHLYWILTGPSIAVYTKSFLSIYISTPFLPISHPPAPLIFSPNLFPFFLHKATFSSFHLLYFFLNSSCIHFLLHLLLYSDLLPFLRKQLHCLHLHIYPFSEALYKDIPVPFEMNLYEAKGQSRNRGYLTTALGATTQPRRTPRKQLAFFETTFLAVPTLILLPQLNSIQGRLSPIVSG